MFSEDTNAAKQRPDRQENNLLNSVSDFSANNEMQNTMSRAQLFQ